MCDSVRTCFLLYLQYLLTYLRADIVMRRKVVAVLSALCFLWSLCNAWNKPTNETSEPWNRYRTVTVPERALPVTIFLAARPPRS